MSAAVEKKRAIVAKIEAAYAVDPVATGAANAILAVITGWRPQIVTYASRAGLAIPAHGQFPSKTAVQWAGIDLDVELTGASAAGTPPPYGPLLRACGFGETIVAVTSVTYAPVSAAQESVAIYANIDGMQQKLLGCRGSVSLAFRNEEIPMLRFRFIGKYATPTDTALPALTLTPHQAPVPMNRTNTTAIALHGFSCGLEEAEIDLAHDVQPVDFPGGTQAVMIVNRNPVGRAVIEHPTMAQKDYNALVESGATGSFTLVHGAGAGRIATLTCAQSRLTDPVPGAVKGIRSLNLALELAPSNAFNDELSLAFT